MIYQADPYCHSSDMKSSCYAINDPIPNLYSHYYQQPLEGTTLVKAVERIFDIGVMASLGLKSTMSCPPFGEQQPSSLDMTKDDTVDSFCGPAHDIAFLQYNLAILAATGIYDLFLQDIILTDNH